MTYRSPRIGIRCDVGPDIGVGHLMRCASLAEEMLDRGWHVEFCADSDSVPLAGERLAEIGCDVRPGLHSVSAHMAWVEESALTASVFDSSLLDPDISRAVTTAIPTLTFIDGSTRGQSASVYVDQNYGAERAAWPIGGTSSPSAPRLAGSSYAGLADRVRRLGPARPQRSAAIPPLTVVVALGGTDALRFTETVVEAIKLLPLQCEVLVVSQRLAHLDSRIPETEFGTHFAFRAPSLEFPQWLSDADIVVSAAGTNLWELCCLGKPVAALAVAENQVAAYLGLVADGAIFGLGNLVESVPGVDQIARSLAWFTGSESLRKSLSQRASVVVDGGGRVRVVDAFESLMN